MANRPLDTALVDKAIKFAVDAHAGTERRGKGFPYVIHVLEAMEITATLTNDPELLAAAALHDTVEDTEVTAEQIRAEFGERIASLVVSETQEVPEGMNETNSWRARRIAGIKGLAAASPDSKMVAMGDKLSNMRAVYRDYKALGEAFWSRFHAPNGKIDYAWYYRSLADSLSDLAGTDAYSEFSTLLHKTFGDPEPVLVNLDDYTQSGEGYTALSYDSKDGRKMMKLYADFMPAHVPLREFTVSRVLTEMGLKIPLATGLVTDGKRLGVEFRRIKPKASFSRAIANHPEQLEELTAKFAGMCRQLHKMPCDTSVFGPADKFFRNEVEKSPYISEEVRAKVLDLIDSTPAATTCIHGDLHIGNALIKTDTGETFWIDLGDFRYGNPLYDLAMFHFTVFVMPKDLAEDIFHLSVEQLREVWKVFLREYYGPEEDLQAAEDRIARYSALLVIRFGNRENGLRPEFKEFIKKYFA